MAMSTREELRSFELKELLELCWEKDQLGE